MTIVKCKRLTIVKYKRFVICFRPSTLYTASPHLTDSSMAQRGVSKTAKSVDRKSATVRSRVHIFGVLVTFPQHIYTGLTNARITKLRNHAITDNAKRILCRQKLMT